MTTLTDPPTHAARSSAAMTSPPRHRSFVRLLPTLGVVALLFALAPPPAAAAKGVLAFERERDIWIAGLDGSWLPGGDLLCTCLPAGKKEPQLCRIPAAGGEAVRLLPRARGGTAAVSR